MFLKEKLEEKLKDTVNEHAALRVVAASEFNQNRWPELIGSAAKLLSIEAQHKATLAAFELAKAEEAKAQKSQTKSE